MNKLGVPMVARYGNGGGHGRRISVQDDGPLTDAPLSKAFIPQLKNAFRPLNPGVKTKIGVPRAVQSRVVETVKDSPKVAAAVAGTSLIAAHKTGTMEKRERTYDPEARRQMNRGVAAGGMGVMGAGATGIGVRNIRASTKELRDTAPKGPAPASDKGGKQTAAAVKSKLRRIGSVGRGRDQALVAGGVAALAGSAKLQSRTSSNRKRGWS
jgi:hypothetical protein